VYRALSDSEPGNLTTHGVGASDWLAGIDIDTFEGETIGERVARAAASIKADILSPVATSVSLPVRYLCHR
jgi:hypothetical protein